MVPRRDTGTGRSPSVEDQEQPTPLTSYVVNQHAADYSLRLLKPSPSEPEATAPRSTLIFTTVSIRPMSLPSQPRQHSQTSVWSLSPSSWSKGGIVTISGLTGKARSLSSLWQSTAKAKSSSSSMLGVRCWLRNGWVELDVPLT